MRLYRGEPGAALLTGMIPLALAALTGCATVGPAAAPAAELDPAALFSTVAALDGAVFDSFNRCDSAEQLEKHAGYFAHDVEFYHDSGGVTWSRKDMLANTQKFVCGKFRRELVPGSLKAFPIKGYGAIAQGVHRFCQAGSDACEGMADFIFVWRHEGGRWQVTRVLSYGHRPAAEPAAGAGASR